LVLLTGLPANYLRDDDWTAALGTVRVLRN
jgi:hypothetical protein